MGKNHIGGKKHKRQKNMVVDNKVDIPTEGQYFAKVIKVLGSGRVNLEYYININEKDKDKEIEWKMNQSIGLIRGSMMKRVWINVGDIILITLRDFDKTKVDIIGKFNQQQLNYLKKHVNIPKIDEQINTDVEFDMFNSDDDNEEQENNRLKSYSTIKNKNSVSYNNIVLIPDNEINEIDESEEEDISN